MPLINGKSKEAFGSNVAAEMDAGKPQKQALAIAYSEKRKAEKRRKMWAGGEMEREEESESDIEDDVNMHQGPLDHEHDEDCGPDCKFGEPIGYLKRAYSDGGEVEPDGLGPVDKDTAEDFARGLFGEEPRPEKSQEEMSFAEALRRRKNR